MIKFIIKRPVAVSMLLIAIVVMSLFALTRIPVSLMPKTQVPRISVQVNAAGLSAERMDEVVTGLRQQLTQTPSLTDIKTVSENGISTLTLSFEYGVDMDYTFVDVNERVDKAYASMPQGFSRPRVVKAGISDLPVFYIDLFVKDSSLFWQMSQVVSNVLVRRLEQIPQVSMVDLAGTAGMEYVIIPNYEKLSILGISPSQLANVIRSGNVNPGSVRLMDGQYHWNVRFKGGILDIDDIRGLHLNVDGIIYTVGELADIVPAINNNDCIVLSEGKRAVQMAVIKQGDSRVSELKKEVSAALDDFSKQYPDFGYRIFRDQTQLLDYTIENLEQNLVVGILLASIVILLFLGNWRFSMLVIPTIPVSLMASILILYSLGMSINIISLAGLILSVGMMVDNSIIVIDNITGKWRRGMNLEDAVSEGASEVFVPMLTSILTTCSVFVPLLFLSGIAGEIFYEQAVTVATGLGTSLVFAVLVIPVYYYTLHKNRCIPQERSFSLVPFYENVLKWCFRRRWVVMLVMVAAIPLSFLISVNMKRSVMPDIHYSDMVIKVDWNSSVSVEENSRRCVELLELPGIESLYSSVISGVHGFLMPHTSRMGISQSLVYISCASPESLASSFEEIRGYLHEVWPEAVCYGAESDNLFSYIFNEGGAPLVVEISGTGSKPLSSQLLSHAVSAVSEDINEVLPGTYTDGIMWQDRVELQADMTLMSLYHIDFVSVESAIRVNSSGLDVLSLNSGESSVPVIIASGDVEDILAGSVVNRDGVEVPLRAFMSERMGRSLKRIVSGKNGNFYPLEADVPYKNVPSVIRNVVKGAVDDGSYSVRFSGGYFSSLKMEKELALIILISVVLLFLILAAQFESVIQPVIILSEIIVDILGALILLLICGESLNVMSLIGIVVMSGIVVNDSILKVDTINRLRRESGYSLIRAIMAAGVRRLSPIIMTSLTTVLALVPFLFASDMGSELQFPLSIVIIGGMVLGTIVSLFGVPLIYYSIYRRSENR